MSTAIAEKPLTHAERGRLGGTRWTPADIERGLQTAALFGSSVKAQEETGIPSSTITYWQRGPHRERWLQIRQELAPKIHAQIAAKTEDLALELAEATREALHRTRETIPDLAGKDAAAATKNLTFALNNAVDKSLLIRGKPTSITEHRTPDEIFRKLEQSNVVDSTAVELDTDQDQPH